jgi:DNA-binding transcriptional LysR family regulator
MLPEVRWWPSASPTHVVWHKDRSMTPARRGFLDTLDETFASRR